MILHPEAEQPDNPPDAAAEDLLIDREDLGPGCTTLVAAGDPVPAHLAHLPRRPRTPAPAKRKAK